MEVRIENVSIVSMKINVVSNAKHSVDSKTVTETDLKISEIILSAPVQKPRHFFTFSQRFSKRSSLTHRENEFPLFGTFHLPFIW